MKVLLLGGTGWIGSHVRARRPDWQWHVVGTQQADLTDPGSVPSLVAQYDVIIHAAGFYGGLRFNQQHQQTILYRNNLISNNVCDLVHRCRPGRVVVIGSACVYPGVQQGMLTEHQIAGEGFHPSVRYSAISKYWLLEMIRDLGVLGQPWEYLILGNVYGPGEHTDAERSHVIGSLCQKIQLAQQELDMMGTGSAVRDFTYIEDAAEAICRYCELDRATCAATNIGTGLGHSVRDVLSALLSISGRDLAVRWGHSSQDGVPHKVLDNSKMLRDIAYVPPTDLATGLEKTWRWRCSI